MVPVAFEFAVSRFMHTTRLRRLFRAVCYFRFNTPVGKEMATCTLTHNSERRKNQTTLTITYRNIRKALKI